MVANKGVSVAVVLLVSSPLAQTPKFTLACPGPVAIQIQHNGCLYCLHSTCCRPQPSQAAKMRCSATPGADLWCRLNQVDSLAGYSMWLCEVVCNRIIKAQIQCKQLHSEICFVHLSCRNHFTHLLAAWSLRRHLSLIKTMHVFLFFYSFTIRLGLASAPACISPCLHRFLHHVSPTAGDPLPFYLSCSSLAEPSTILVYFNRIDRSSHAWSASIQLSYYALPTRCYKQLWMNFLMESCA